MVNLEIYKTDSLDFKLKRKGDLLYYEGPLVSHFVTTEPPTQHYLPTEDSFYDPQQYDSYAIHLKNDLSKPSNVSDYDRFLDMFETIKREVSDIKIAQQRHDESLLKLLAKQTR